MKGNKKKIALISLSACCSVLLMGCQLGTPLGTFTLGFDENQKTEGFVIIDDDGSVKQFNTQDINSQIDGLIDGVDLPNGATTDDLKSFVNGTSDALGVKQDINEAQGTVDDMTEVLNYANPMNMVDDIDIGDVVNETSVYSEEQPVESTEQTTEGDTVVEQTELVEQTETEPAEQPAE